MTDHDDFNDDLTVSDPDSGHGSESDSEVGSNERTNERTNASDPYGWQSGHRSERVRARIDDDTDIPMLGDIIATGFMRTWERHDVIRTGEREPIPAHVRAAVWYRDHGLCALCPGLEYQPDGPLHLDHIVPWSAGGPDTSDNLRLLCEPHNLERSNFIDHAGPKLPVTWWCHRCYTENHTWEHYTNGDVVCPIHRERTGPDGPRCRVARAYRRGAEQGLFDGTNDTFWANNWHLRADPIRSFHLIAYCAHCNKPGETSLTL